MLLPKLSVEQEYRTRFTREACIASRLNHPNVVQVYDTGEGRGLAFMIMEFLQGRSLYSSVPEDTRRWSCCLSLRTNQPHLVSPALGITPLAARV